MVKRSSASIVLSAVACTAAPDGNSGNEALGVAAFETSENEHETVVKGFDDGGSVVAQMTLRYGQLAERADDGTPTGRQIDGRIVDVDIRGETVWLQASDHRPFTMPRVREPAAAMILLDDPHVKPILDRFAIEFSAARGPSAGAEIAYDYNPHDEIGVWPMWCTNGTPGTCYNAASGQTYGAGSGNTNSVCNSRQLLSGITVVLINGEEFGDPQIYLDQCCYNADTGVYFQSIKECSQSQPTCPYVLSNQDANANCTTNFSLLVPVQTDSYDNTMYWIGHSF